MSIFVPRGGREASPHLLVDNEDLVWAFATVIKRVRCTWLHELDAFLQWMLYGYAEALCIMRVSVAYV